MSEFRRRLMMVGGGGALPYDAEVEFLRSSGTQAYIDTGIAYDGTIELEAKFTINTSGSSGAYAFGLYYSGSNGTYRWSLNKGNSTTVKPHFGTITSKSTTLSLNTFHDIKADYRYFTKDGTVIDSTASSFTTDWPVSIYLFCRHAKTTSNDSANSFLDCSFGRYTIKINGQIVQNCKPVRKDGVGYFYDSITKNLLGNANSVGAFTYGNDVNI